MDFQLIAPFKPTGDQPQAINRLVSGIKAGFKNQVLLGVTGCGKTFTTANVIEKLKRPTLVVSHNKTLAAQLYQEFRDFFPNNAVSYFVSYYDYYQPEAYIPQTDTYIEKETDINEEIDKLRLSATSNLLSRDDVIIVASVSCIYNLGSPIEYSKSTIDLEVGTQMDRETLVDKLVDLYYERTSLDFRRGTFRVQGDIVDLIPAYMDQGVRILFTDCKIKAIKTIDPLNGDTLAKFSKLTIYPAKHYIAAKKTLKEIFVEIRQDLALRVKELKQSGRLFEAERLLKRVNFDLEMIEELGYVNGIENYSRYFDRRKKGEPPYTLLDYFEHSHKRNWLLIIDESHMTIPQIQGMYLGDKTRKETLVEFGFRLPAAFDNRPLTLKEFLKRIPQTIYVSATPARWEIERANKPIVEQLIRPTGILDPDIVIGKPEGQIVDLVSEIIERKLKNQRVLVTTLTKRTAEDLSSYLNEKKYLQDKRFKDVKRNHLPLVCYLHSDIETLVRSNILDDLRSGKYDVIIGINLLREGLDLPEVSLVAILDADREGFLRSETSLIQTMGRAARHVNGRVIMYAERVTGSMKRAIAEIKRRRKVQLDYNKKHKITPVSVKKPIRKKLTDQEDRSADLLVTYLDSKKRAEYSMLLKLDVDQLIPADRSKLVKKLTAEMKRVASELNFELAAEIRDRIMEIKDKSSRI